MTHALHCSLYSTPDLWLIHGLSAKKGGNNFHFSASPWDRYASELATIHQNDSFTLRHVFSLCKLDRHQWSYTSLYHPKYVAPHFHGTELSHGRFWAASQWCRLDAPWVLSPAWKEWDLQRVVCFASLWRRNGAVLVTVNDISTRGNVQQTPPPPPNF